ncbi:MAG TPA: AraC family transcriptional regulator [Candidatus Methylacidiphilales bacterium]|nr:AraC family transcriptional regulator [Candidatus Methylacidiphilales bacterium]
MAASSSKIFPAVPGISTDFTVEDFSVLHHRLLWCYEGEVLEENRNRHCRERHTSVWLLREGCVTLRCGRKSWRANEGQWIFGTTQPHHQCFSTDARILSVNFKVQWPSGESLIDEPLVVAGSDFPELEQAALPLLAFVREHFKGVRNDLWGARTDVLKFFQLHQLFSLWLVAYVQAALASRILPTRMAGLDSRILAALRYLDHRPWAAPFREQELADSVGLSVSHLNRLFVGQLALTPRGYLQKRRFASATALLAEEDTPVKKIAYNLGFSSPGHFCYWFRKASGRSPLEWRTAGEVLNAAVSERYDQKVE